MKIYCVLCDAMPLTKRLLSLSAERKANFLVQASNSHTQTSVLSLITGKLPSDIMEHGYGWNMFNKEMIANKEQPWHSDNFLHKAIEENGWDVVYHDSTWLYDRLYSNPEIIESSAYPGGIKTEKVSAWDDIHETMLNDAEDTVPFYEREKQFIDSFQKQKEKNTFHFITYHQVHAAIAKNPSKMEAATDRMCDLISQFDLDEPDSLFIFFADHGDFRFIDRYCTPPHPWCTWAMIKDNTKDSKISKKMIEIKDLYYLIADKIGIDCDTQETSNDFYSPQDKERVYFMEDGRQAVDMSRSTTAAAIKVLEWTNHGYPSAFLQLSYHKPEKKFTSYLFNPMTQTVQLVAEIDEELKKSLIERFAWVSDQ